MCVLHIRVEITAIVPHDASQQIEAKNYHQREQPIAYNPENVSKGEIKQGTNDENKVGDLNACRATVSI